MSTSSMIRAEGQQYSIPWERAFSPSSFFLPFPGIDLTHFCRLFQNIFKSALQSGREIGKEKSGHPRLPRNLSHMSKKAALKRERERGGGEDNWVFIFAAAHSFTRSVSSSL